VWHHDIADGCARPGDGDGGGHRLTRTYALQHRVGSDPSGELEDGGFTRLAALGNDIGGTERPG
jgi:hypothetical protein